ncbi:MAG TPA: hypothetical protein VHA52_08170 [Candidatus Babeliaceae bacterium]|nr:hypothetical protein [Candidatus Babeliaceae bacterium]
MKKTLLAISLFINTCTCIYGASNLLSNVNLNSTIVASSGKIVNSGTGAISRVNVKINGKNVTVPVNQDGIWSNTQSFGRPQVSKLNVNIPVTSLSKNSMFSIRSMVNSPPNILTNPSFTSDLTITSAQESSFAITVNVATIGQLLINLTITNQGGQVVFKEQSTSGRFAVPTLGNGNYKVQITFEGDSVALGSLEIIARVISPSSKPSPKPNTHCCCCCR